MPILSVRLSDAYGRTTNKRFEIEEQALLADYVTAIGTFISDLEAVTDLGVEKVDLIIPQDGYASTPTALSNVDVGATFSGLLAAGNGKKASMKVPGIQAALVDADGSVPLAGATATFLANFETAGAFMLSDGETIDSWLRGILDK